MNMLIIMNNIYASHSTINIDKFSEESQNFYILVANY